ncbi:MAG: hypothetical protein DMF92_08425 [Acidobacteria bacterium]|nr:MAG: hypothetical protein DMF92_08425 [Acidobacteriota bacterium]
MRHKLEYVIVKALIAAVRVMPEPLVRGCGGALGLAFYTFDRAHRRIAKNNLAEAFPGASRDCPRRVRAFRAPAVRDSEVQHSLTRGDARVRGVRRRGPGATSVRARKGRALLHRPLRLLGAARHRPRPADRADRRARPSARQPRSQRAPRADSPAHR